MIDFSSLGYGIGAVGGALSSLFGGGAGDAAQQGAEAGQKTDWWAMAETSAAIQRAMAALETGFSEANQVQQPFYQAGVGGVNALRDSLTPQGGLSQTDMVSGLPPGAGNNLMDFLTKTQAYQFPLQQGLQLLDQGAAARGNALGGGQTKAIQQYGQNYAMSNALAPAQTNYQNYLKNLSSMLAGPGQISANQLGQYAMQTGQNMANVNVDQAKLQNALAGDIAGLQSQAGQAQQASSLYNQNTLGNLFGGIGSLIQQAPWSSIGVGSGYGGAGGAAWMLGV